MGAPLVETLRLGWPSYGRRFLPPTKVSKTMTCALPSPWTVAMASLCPGGSSATSFDEFAPPVDPRWPFGIGSTRGTGGLGIEVRCGDDLPVNGQAAAAHVPRTSKRILAGRQRGRHPPCG